MSRRTRISRREFLHNAAIVAAGFGTGAFVLPPLFGGRRIVAVQAGQRLEQRVLVGQGTLEEPSAGHWNTWVLSSGAEIRLPQPTAVSGPVGISELAQLKRAQLERTQAQIDAARFWDAGPATKRWTEIHLQMIKTHRPNPPRAARGLALAHLAMADALIAAWRAKYLYNHPSPGSVEPTLTPAMPLRSSPSYPSEHAVAAGAASQVLKYLFPQQGSEWFEARAQEAATSRIWAGVDWPGAVEQGLVLGRTVAQKVLAHAAADGSDTAWAGTRPSGICYWKPTPPAFVFPPLEPAWGSCKPWLLERADRFRPGPPPTCGSAREHEQHLEVYRVVNGLTEEQQRIASFWNDGPGTATPPGHWFEIALGLVERYNLNTPRAARLCAHLGAVVMTAGICVWDAKYAYWSLRPVTYIQDYIDRTWTSFIPTPPFPGYVSGHSGFSGGAAEVLGYAFPRERVTLRSMAAEAALSRLYGGIHIRADNEVGLAMGRLIGALAGARALRDDVEDLVGRGTLDRRQGQSMTARLGAAITKVNQGNYNGAINELRTFASQVGTALKSPERETLIAAVDEISAEFAAAK